MEVKLLLTALFFVLAVTNSERGFDDEHFDPIPISWVYRRLTKRGDGNAKLNNDAGPRITCIPGSKWTVALLVKKCNGSNEFNSYQPLVEINLNLSLATDEDLTHLLSKTDSIYMPVILSNTKATSIPLCQLEHIIELVVEDNPKLIAIYMGRLETVGLTNGLFIRNNPNLFSVAIGALYNDSAALSVKGDGLVLSNNRKLIEFSLELLHGQKAENVTAVRISGNPVLTEWFLQKMNNFFSKVPSDRKYIQEYGECEFPEPIKDLNDLSICKYVLGNVVISSFAANFIISNSGTSLPEVRNGSFIIKGTKIQDLSILIGITADGLELLNNPLLCEFLDVLDSNPYLNSITTFEDNCHACNTWNTPLINFQLLSRCEKIIFGDVKFDGHVAPMPRWINLERIYGCFEIIGTDLTTVKFLVGTRTRSDCVNVIKNNKKICDVAEVLDNTPEGTLIEAENNCEKVCYDAAEVWKKDCEVLHTISDLPISYLKQSKTLKRVHGPIKITSLKTGTVDSSMLPQIEYDELVFRANEFLCDEEAVRKLIPKGKKVSFKQNCWKRCSYPQILYGRKCTVFAGILDHRLFDNMELFERVLRKLEGVEGQIKIVGSYAQNLDFRKLKYVKNDKFPGPAILIENNKILKTVFLENLETVTSKTEPKIRIKHNGDFKFEAKDWKKIRDQTKTRLHKSLVVDIHRTKTKAPEKCSKDDDSSFKVVSPKKGFLYYGAVTILLFLCIVIIILFGLFFWCCYKVESGNY